VLEGVPREAHGRTVPAIRLAQRRQPFRRLETGMPSSTSFDDPSEPCARARLHPGRAELHSATGSGPGPSAGSGRSLLYVDPDDPVLRATLAGWDWTARGLARDAVTNETRLRLGDGRRIVGELARVLAGAEAGEGTADRRVVVVARERSRIQGVASLFVCPRAVFVELVATAPWNLLGGGEPRHPLAVRGAGSALVAHACARSVGTGRGGRVALQAENPRCRALYERLGFVRMTAEDLPYTLVPPGDGGFSAAVRRLAEGREGPEEARSPWMLFDPERLPSSGAVTVPARAAARAVSAAP
jgi:hypothetical protein